MPKVKRFDLSNIEYQLRRAKEHLADLEVEIGDIVESNHEIRTSDGDSWQGEGPSSMFGEIEATEESPRPIRGKVGEFAISLRAALDYMTVLLAKYDSMSDTVGKRVQFPMEDCPDSFTNHRKTFLRGVSDEHVAFFERYQPYNRCDWMRRLRELSNTGKHIDLVVVKTDYSRLHGTVWDGGDDEAGGADDGREVYVQEVSAEISFPDRTPVIDALQTIQTKVAQIFKEFRALFAP